jgi:hypothetical protein
VRRRRRRRRRRALAGWLAGSLAGSQLRFSMLGIVMMLLSEVWRPLHHF